MASQADLNPPTGLSFGELLDWHLRRGTRPLGSDKQGEPWKKAAFAEDVGVSDKQVRNWTTNKSLPNNTIAIERILFGRDQNYRRTSRMELRDALKRTRSSSNFRPQRYLTLEVSDNAAVTVDLASTTPIRNGHVEPHLPFINLNSAIVDGSPDISRLLRWNYRLVDKLFGRTEDHKTIIDWVESRDPQVLVRIVEGQAGSGKTRLAAEVAHTLRSRGWTAGFLATSGSVSYSPSRSGLFLIVDYPEEQSHRVTALVSAIRENRQPGYALRLLFLSRRKFDLWADAIAPIRDLCGHQPIASLGPLIIQDARELVEEAVATLSRLLGRRTRPRLTGLYGWLQKEDSHRLSLFATAAAIHLATEATATFALDAPAIIYELVTRERARISTASKRAGLGPHALPRLLALATLVGKLHATNIRRLAAPKYEIAECSRSEIIDRLAGESWWDKSTVSLPALTPDILAAAFAKNVLAERSDIAWTWFWPAFKGAIDADFSRRLDRVIYDMDRVAPLGPSPVPDWLDKMLESHPKIVAFFAPLSQDTHLSHRLASFAASITTWLVAVSESAGNLEALAGYLNNLSVHLMAAGKPKEALNAALWGLDVLTDKLKADPDAADSRLAIALTNTANLLSQAGLESEALGFAAKAVEIGRRLFEADRTAFGPEFVGSLINLASRLAVANHSERALVVAREALAVCEELAEDTPDDVLPYFGGALTNIADLLADAGQPEEGIAAARRGVDVYDRLARSNPGRFEPELATSLHNLAVALAAHRPKLAITAENRAVAILNRLMAMNPQRFGSELCSSLRTLTQNYLDAGDSKRARLAAQRAVDIARQLATVDGVAFRQLEANNLEALAQAFEDDQPAEAANILGEAADIYDRAIKAGQKTFASGLARTLRKLAGLLRDSGRHLEAISALQRSSDLYERLQSDINEDAERDFARNFYQLGELLVLQESFDAALSTFQCAAEIYKRLARKNPAEFEHPLAALLIQIGKCHRSLGDGSSAITAQRRAIAICERSLVARKSVVDDILCSALVELSVALRETGAAAEAILVAERAVAASERIGQAKVLVSLCGLMAIAAGQDVTVVGKAAMRAISVSRQLRPRNRANELYYMTLRMIFPILEEANCSAEAKAVATELRGLGRRGRRRQTNHGSPTTQHVKRRSK